MLSELLENINKRSAELTNSQKIVAHYLSENVSVIAFNTLDELAAKIGVSTTTVIRFARSLGYRGYSDMQQDIQRSLQDKAGLPERFSDSASNLNGDQLLLDSFQNEVNNLNQTLAGLDKGILDEATSAIIQARHVYTVGMRGAFSLAHFFATRLGQVREYVRLIQAIGDIYPEEINGAGEGDLCIAFMFPRYSKMTASIVSACRKRGVKVLLFTGANNFQVRPYGDIVIPCYVQGTSLKNSFVVPMAVINYLVTTVTMNSSDAKNTLETTEDMLSHGYYLGL